MTGSKRSSRRALGLDPAAPEAAAVPGGVTPAFGAAPTRAQDWRFDFHGYFLAPLRFGINERQTAGDGLHKTVLHVPPLVPDDLHSFNYTSVVPNPWAQLNFSYGNRDVTATIIVAARSISEGNAYFNPPDQLGINNAFLTFRVPTSVENFKLSFNVGAFANRYGVMGEYDLGRYGTPIIARVGGVGITGTGVWQTGDLQVLAEAGVTGQLNKAPLGVEPAGWNGYLDPNVGSSFVAHAHGGIGYRGRVSLGLHYLRAFSADDRATPQRQPDGYIEVVGAELRFTLGRFGHLAAIFAKTGSFHARAVSGVMRILNARGGPGLMESYFGPNSDGTGDLKTMALQYDISIGNLLRYPAAFQGNGPDVVASLFGVFTHVNSPDPLYNAIDKTKYGGELTCSLLSWLAFSGRYDRVISDTKDPRQTTAIISPRILFRSDFNARDVLVLQYSRYINGSSVMVKSGDPPVWDPSVRPDEDILSLIASMWW